MTQLWPEGAPIRVRTADDTPRAFSWAGRRWQVRAVVDQWVVHDNWWRDEIWRHYFQVETVDGALCVLFRDVLDDAWCLERVYD